MGNPMCTGKGWRKEKGPLWLSSGSKVGAGDGQDEAGKAGMMLEPLRPLEFMVGVATRTPGLSRKVLPATGRGVPRPGGRGLPRGSGNDELGHPSRVGTTRWLEKATWGMGWGCLSRGREGLGSQLRGHHVWDPCLGVRGCLY